MGGRGESSGGANEESESSELHFVFVVCWLSRVFDCLSCEDRLAQPQKPFLSVMWLRITRIRDVFEPTAQPVDFKDDVSCATYNMI